MLYLERRPVGVLAPLVRMFWLAQDAGARSRPGCQRVLPNGCMQIIVSVSGRSLTDLSDGVRVATSAELMVGVQRRFQTIATEDLEDLVGVVFQPGGFRPLFGRPADEFCDLEVPLAFVPVHWVDLLRSQLREVRGPARRLDVLERMLAERLRRTDAKRCALTGFALAELSRGTAVAEIARQSGYSTRWLGEAFRREVGVSPKVYDRILRFQRAVRMMHDGKAMGLAELALDCGFYDQAHFVHEFQMFSGMCPTSYQKAHRPWSNHIAD